MATRTDLSSMSDKSSSSKGGKRAAGGAKSSGGGGGKFSLSPRTMALGGLVLVMAIASAVMWWPESEPPVDPSAADGMVPTTPGSPGVPPGEPPVIPPAPAQPGSEGFSPS